MHMPIRIVFENIMWVNYTCVQKYINERRFCAG